MNFNDKTFQAVCRVCRKPVLRQNYKDHLKDVHKGEDLLDQRQWGDPDNRDLFRGLTSSGDKNHNVRRTDGEGNTGSEAGTDSTGTKRIRLEKDVVGEDLSDVVEDLSQTNRGDDVTEGRGGGRSRSGESRRSESRESNSSRSRERGRSGSRGRSLSRSRSGSRGRRYMFNIHVLTLSPLLHSASALFQSTH